MIVKIWPINAHYPKDKKLVGGMKGLVNCLNYITDADKVIVNDAEIGSMNFLNQERMLANGEESAWEQDEHRVLNYMANEEKIKGKYISGYLCHPESAVEQFEQAREFSLSKTGVTREKETGAVAFHMVQSFPEGLDISDEEVHQCGLELCEKLGLHQAVICSHVHPVLDETDGKVHGKSKHNHILINAYIHPDKLEPGAKILKYNDCKDSYAQLQIWNDEIAIDHGLPIIRNPDKDRVYSWTETKEANEGRSWKERIRLDIESARRASSNWNEFMSIMEHDGYTIRDGKYTSYTAPDGVSKARGHKLGREYSRDSLELYWSVRNYGYKALETSIEDNAAPPPPLSDLVLGVKGRLTAAVPLGPKEKSGRQHKYLPLEDVQHKKDALLTYFNSDELYDICDENNRPVAAATGQEILDCIEQLRDGKKREEQEFHESEQQMRNRQLEDEAKRKEEINERYMFSRFKNSRSNQYYKTARFDAEGNKRSNLELVFVLAMTIIRSEASLWEKIQIPPGKENDPIYCSTDWKVQNMMDSIYIAKQEKIETPGQLDVRLKDAGTNVSIARSALQKTSRAKEKMETLKGAVGEYRETNDIASRILAMEECPEKEQMKRQYADLLERHKVAKAVLYRYKVTDDSQIQEFEDRYDRIGEDIQYLQERFDTAKEEYRRLKKLSYNLSLADNAQYCYGPAYTEAGEYERDSDEARNRRATLEELLKDQHVGPIRDIREKDIDEEKEMGG